MRLPLKVEYDYSPETGSQASILDADNRLIVEGLGPEATWRDFEEIVTRVNSTLLQEEDR